MKRRHELINWFINKYGYTSYLEIGLDQPKNCFDHIECNYKVSVDPAVKIRRPNHYAMTSDAFFEKYKVHLESILDFDIIFIDGLHQCDQVIRDIGNSLYCLRKGGTIIVHDCNPKSEIEADPIRRQSRWNGDVWKAFAYYRTRSWKLGLYMHTIDIDEGCGVIRRVTSENKIQLPYDGPYETYQDLVNNRDAILKLKSTDDLDVLFH